MAVTTFDGAMDHLGAHQELAVQVGLEGEALDPIGHGAAQLLGLHCAGEVIITWMRINVKISSPGLVKGTLVMRVAMRWDSSTVQFTTAPSEEQLATKQTGELEIGVDVIDLSI